jgi:hypothetical protein
MKSCHQSCLASLLLFFFISPSFAQDQRTFNQNAPRSNNRGLSISFSPVYSSDMNSKDDSLLFRGTGVGFRFGADYFFGKAGIGFSSGFGSSSPNDATINSFLKRSPFPPDGLIVSKARQQNMYLLLGPSIRFGKTVELYGHAKGGLFINNSGLVSIQQKGAQRAMYRNESTAKSIYPGFLTGMGVQYKTKSDVWSFGIGLDYMNTRSEVNNYDARRGAGIEALKLSQKITDLVTGITVRYNIISPRDHASGQASGKKHTGNVKYSAIKAARDAGSGLATGKRTYQPGKPVYGNITRQEPANESCGTVTQTITNPDGTTEEMTFACPDDAANYNNRISMNVTVPKQTQGATFGEKVNQGLHAAGSALSQGASMKGIVHRDLAARNIISGRLSWTSSGERMGIVTNRTIERGGSTTLNSQTSSTRQTNQSSFGTLVRISARERGSGMATGKRSSEKGSGVATGRRQYEPIFSEGQGDVCNPCVATAKMSGVQSNPLYKDKGMTGKNSLYQEKERVMVNADEDCIGVAEADIFLIEAGSGTIVAKTKTEPCGDFFFANIPDGDYTVKVSGSFTGKKGYDVYLNPKAIGSKADLRGGITAADDWNAQLLINTDNGNNEMTQKAGISTSRSNIRNRTLTIIEADVDGDGEYESLQATGTFSDGSSQDITSAARKTISNASGTKGIILEGNALKMRRRVEVLKSNKQGYPDANRITSIAVLRNVNKLTATGTFSDGTTREVTENLEVNTDHSGVKQYSITVSDLDDDGMADAIIKTKTKSNQSNDRMAAGEVDDNNNGMINAKAKITKSRSNIQNNRMSNEEESNDIWSPRSNIKILSVATGDVDGDGKAESLVGGSLPGGAVISAFAMPGDPIPGLDVKLGKNPGGQSLQNTTTNANGEFEFTNLKAGDYTLTIEQKILIEDETPVTLGGNNTKAQDHNSSRSNKSSSVAGDNDNEEETDNAARKGWDGTVKGGSKTRAQDHNSSRSNKSSSVVADDQDNEEETDNIARKGWDGTVKGGSKTKAQDHNSSRSNKSSSIATDDQDNEEEADNIARKGWDGTVKGGSKTKAQDHNSSRSNKSSSVADDNDNEEETDNAARKGWDGTVKGASKTKAQDHNSSRSNKSSGVADDNDHEEETDNAARKGWDGTVKGASKTKAQDHNSYRSNKSSSVVASDQDNVGDENKKSNTVPIKWTAPESLKRTVNTSRGNIKNIISSLDDLEDQLNIDASNEQKLVNTNRSNIKNQRLTVNELHETLSNIEYMDKETAMHEVNRKMKAMNSQFQTLQESIMALGGKYSSISNVLKQRHDIAMNSIRNMK